MSNTIVTPQYIIQSSAIGAARNPPLRVLSLVPPKDKKSYSGSVFIKTKCMTYATTGDRIFNGIIAGHRQPLDIHLQMGASVFGSRDKDKKRDGDDKGNNNAKKAALKMQLSMLPPDFRQAMEILESDYTHEVTRPEIGGLWRNPQMNAPIISCHIKRVYTAKCPDAEKIGQQRPEPIIDLKIRFDNFPANFGQLSGQPRSIIYDWATRKIVDGVETFDQRVDKDGKTINSSNCGDIVSPGDTIRRIELMTDSASVNSDGFSFGISIHKLWTERTGVFSNVLETCEEAVIAPSIAPQIAPQVTEAPQIEHPHEEKKESTLQDSDDEDDGCQS